MKKVKSVIIIISLIACLTGIIMTSSIPAQEKPAASILSIVNNVQAKSQGKWEQAYKGMELNYGSQIKTLEDSKAMIIFNDGTQMKLDSSTTIAINKKEEIQKSQVGIIELITGTIWSKIRPTNEGTTPVFEVKSPTGTCAVRGTEIAMRVNKDNKENFYTTLTVISGEAEFGNQNGKSLVPAKCQSSAYKETAPTKPVQLSQKQIDSEISWINFGNPRIMVLVEEINLEKPTFVSEMESQINTQLTDSHYHVIDPGQVDTIRESDEAKKAISGDEAAAATLGKRFACDVTVAGKVETIFISEQKSGENSQIVCEARCDIKVIVTDTAQLLFSRKLKAEGTSLSREAAGIRAIENISKKIADDLICEIPMGYITAEKGRRATQIIVENCSFTERDKIIEFLKTIPDAGGKIYPRTFENSIAIIDVEYNGTSEALVHEIQKIQGIKIEITGVTMNRITIKVIK